MKSQQVFFLQHTWPKIYYKWIMSPLNKNGITEPSGIFMTHTQSSCTFSITYQTVYDINGVLTYLIAIVTKLL